MSADERDDMLLGYEEYIDMLESRLKSLDPAFEIQ